MSFSVSLNTLPNSVFPLLLMEMGIPPVRKKNAAGRARPLLSAWQRFLTALNRCGAITAIDPCGNHLSVQNLADEPSPRITETEASNIAETCRSGFDGNRLQFAAVSVLRNHSHLSRRAKPTIFKSGTPRPP